MKLILRTAIAAVSIASIPPAMADEGGGPNPSTRFTEPPGVIAQPPAHTVPPSDTAQTDVHSGHGPWIFPPIGKYFDQSARG